MSAPVTIAVKVVIPPAMTDVVSGEIETATTGEAVTSTVAAAFFEGSATLVATTWAGARRSPGRCSSRRRPRFRRWRPPGPTRSRRRTGRSCVPVTAACEAQLSLCLRRRGAGRDRDRDALVGGHRDGGGRLLRGVGHAGCDDVEGARGVRCGVVVRRRRWCRRWRPPAPTRSRPSTGRTGFLSRRR